VRTAATPDSAVDNDDDNVSHLPIIRVTFLP